MTFADGGLPETVHANALHSRFGFAEVYRSLTVVCIPEACAFSSRSSAAFIVMVACTESCSQDRSPSSTLLRRASMTTLRASRLSLSTLRVVESVTFFSFLCEVPDVLSAL